MLIFDDASNPVTAVHLDEWATDRHEWVEVVHGAQHRGNLSSLETLWRWAQLHAGPEDLIITLAHPEDVESVTRRIGGGTYRPA